MEISAEDHQSDVEESFEDVSDLICTLKGNLEDLRSAYKLEVSKTTILVKKLREIHHREKMRMAVKV